MKRVIKVRFLGTADGIATKAHDNIRGATYTKDYEYFYVDEGQEIKDKSFAVVDVGGTLKIVAVVGVQKSSCKANKYAICVFNLEEHEKVIDKEKRIQALREDILARAEDAKKRRQLEELAKDDATLADMLKELDALEDSTNG